MNWLGSSTASHSTLRMPEASPWSTRVSMCCRPWPNSWKSVSTSSKRHQRRLAADRRRLVADQVRDRQARAAVGVGQETAAADALVHPRAAALLGRAASTDPDRTRRAARPTRRRRGRSARPGARPTPRRRPARMRTPKSVRGQLEQPVEHARQRKVRPQLLLAVRVALLAQALGPVRRRPTGRASAFVRRARARTRAAPRGRAAPRRTRRGAAPPAAAPRRRRRAPSSSPG